MASNINVDKLAVSGEFSLPQICRLCLQKLEADSSVNLFAVNFSIRPSQMIIRCAAIEIDEHDGLPHAICNDCFYKLGIAYEFRTRCEASDQQLRAYVVNQRKLAAPQLDVVRDEEIYEAMNAILEPNETAVETSPRIKVKKKYPVIQKKAKLDELLVKHNAKLKEERSKFKIFLQKRIRRKNNESVVKKGKFLDKPEQCFICGKSFNYSGYLKAHQRIHTGEKPYECQICHRRFAQAGNLYLHRRTHLDERKYQCEICSKLFKTSSNLHAHRKTHSEERDHLCSLCNRPFKTAIELRKHMEIHSSIKNYVCQICNKSFNKQSYLNSHIKTIHIGVKGHKCQDCEKIFSNSSNLIAHRRIHTGDRPYECKECDSKFTQSPSLLRHIKAKHTPKITKPMVPEPPLEPSIEVDENRSLDSAASSELSVATSLIENQTSYMSYMPNYSHQPQLQMVPNQHIQMQQPATTANNLYSSNDLYQFPSAGSSNHPSHHYQQQHLDVGSYDLCYSMPNHSTVLNPSLINPQPTYIFDQ
ncbi:zinc finger protein 391-like [Uranotaenia lowii]|uniref:zinc finger protein 391-like n=1 Tax=Uranotaenia lowii TaxID=190385 RepID=UPI00247965A6|nr:zinc finger protein 391-like [Uranotaenia lowii]XP_055599329.1 zinc finger protein 391-like [Uranotaenia lowii]